MDENKIDWIEDLKKVSLKPGDVLVIKTKNFLLQRDKAYIESVLIDIFPNNKVIVLLPDMDLGVISKEDSDA